MQQARGRAIDVLLFVIGVGIIGWGVAFLNEDMRRQMGTVLAGDRSSQVAMVAASATRLTRPVLETFNSYWIMNPWLVGFAIVTLVLFVFIFRA